MATLYKKTCKGCGDIKSYATRDTLNKSTRMDRLCKSCCRKNKTFSPEHRKKLSLRKLGGKQSEQSKLRNSVSQKNRFLNPDERKKISECTRLALRRPEVRNNHISALSKINFLGNTVDVGQLELLEKWHRLGFNFEPNYQLHTNDFLCYIDGYDKENNVVFEYDSKYHLKLCQKEKDRIRQCKIIDLLKPKKFWRYNAEHKTFKNVIGDL
jgi:hypothetical protein